MKLAAIDIGSNAVRLLIKKIHAGSEGYSIEKVSFYRVPLRLGSDVFETGSISARKQDQLVKTMRAFWYLMDVHEVEQYRAVATSATREAENREVVCQEVKRRANIDIEVITGSTEADLIVSNFMTNQLDPNGHYLYIDVGGGSTEISFIHNGERVKGKSFPIGTVRMLKDGVHKKDWVKARQWLKETVKKNGKELMAVGTGGNINKIFKEVGKKPGRPISAKEIEEVYDHLRGFTYEERVTKLGLRPDRADVILPAAEIYHTLMRFAEVKHMLVPKVGLSDGIVLDLFERWLAERR